jgi:hypothetical protein
LGRIALTERQITNRVALDEISGLIELKVIKQMGKWRSVHYVLL